MADEQEGCAVILSVGFLMVIGSLIGYGFGGDFKSLCLGAGIGGGVFAVLAAIRVIWN